VAVKKTNELLTDFKDGLSNENDNFNNPSLPISLNGRFLDKIDLSALKRYYKLKGTSNYDNLVSFLNQSNILGVYYDMFMNELNYFRTRFQISEQIFQRHKLLSINLVNEVAAGKYEPHSTEFAQEYVMEVQRLFKNENIVKDGTIINRTQLSEQFVKNLAILSGKYIGLDAKASEVNQIANEVIAARIDMDTLKTSMADAIAEHIPIFEKLGASIDLLLDKG